MKISRTVTIDASADQAWQVLGEQFAHHDQWASAILESSMDRPVSEGAVRHCKIQGFGPVKGGTLSERLVDYRPQQMRLGYRVLSGLPPLIRSATNHWRVDALGAERCTISSNARMNLAWWAVPLAPLLKWRLGVDLDQAFDELKHHIERGEPHPQKVAALQSA